MAFRCLCSRYKYSFNLLVKLPFSSFYRHELSSVVPMPVIIVLWWKLGFAKNRIWTTFAVSLQWRELVFQGPVPPPRCGHTATMVEKRMLIFGGRGE